MLNWKHCYYPIISSILIDVRCSINLLEVFYLYRIFLDKFIHVMYFYCLIPMNQIKWNYIYAIVFVILAALSLSKNSSRLFHH